MKNKTTLISKSIEETKWKIKNYSNNPKYGMKK